MPRRRALSCAICLLGALGCQQRGEATSSHSSELQDVSPPRTEPLAAESRPDSPPEPTVHPGSPPESTDHPGSPPIPSPEASESPPAVIGPLDVAAIPGGALVVWSRHDGEMSDILITRLDARGVEEGGPRLVRRTHGEVLDLAVQAAPDGVWLAWVSDVSTSTGSRGLVAALAVASDLSATSSPLTLDRFDGENFTTPARPLVRLLALDRRSAIVAALGAAVPCRDIVGQEGRCTGYHVRWIRDADRADLVAQLAADGDQATLASLVDVGAGFVLGAWAWHGGATHTDVYIARDTAAVATPRFRRVYCRPPFIRGFDGRSLVTLCEGDYADPGERCDDDLCQRVHVVGLDDTLVTPPRAPNGPLVVARRPRCHDGHPVLDVGWKGGQLRLDPQRPGASLDLDDELGVWTGAYALKIGEDGAIARARCRGDRLVDDRDASLPDRLALDAPVVRRLSVRASG